MRMHTAAVVILAALVSPVMAAPIDLAGATVETAFAPGDEPAQLIATAIGEARREVRVMTYQLSNGRIINALRAAAGRHVDVKVIVDGKTCDADRLAPVLNVLTTAGVGWRCDYQHPIHHNKVVVVDGRSVATGSFNFSPSAERNAENTIYIRDSPALATAFLAAWEEHQAHAEPRRGQ
jgi:phosphatidylserine/phosphatidylglycerophosphate/cardiolipin synthase-like enzyme